ncbi:MAG: quinone-dependent dihydroorotate dehydrogenase [Thermoanaerobaculia bacterium]
MYGLARPLLFRLDAESAHELTAHQLERLGAIPPLLAAVAAACRPRSAPRSLWGVSFPNPLGIAAGFDKNATMIDALEALGFGFIEVGTVTLLPQPGNPRPRLFRLPGDRALVNRMGFNNDGAAAIATRLRRRVERRGTVVKPPAPVFVNVGRNRDVEADAAAAAYAACYAAVAPWAEGAVVNVSSPNTPNLRDLQRPEQLVRILEAVREERARARFATGGAHPILVKIAPDVDSAALREIADVCLRLADGIVATNTTIERSGLTEAVDEPGGLSGRPLFARSTEVLREVRALVGPDYSLVGVGGIEDARTAREKLAAGADLVQAYTGFIYGGPRFARRVADGIAS